MKQIKEIFLGQLSDSLNKRATDKLLNERQQKEIIKENAKEEQVLAQQQEQLKKHYKQKDEDNNLDNHQDNVSLAKLKADSIVG